MWTSFGICTETLAFLDVNEIVDLQALCKFSYKILVSRVQMRIAIQAPRLFVDGNSVVRFIPYTNKVRKLEGNRSFWNTITV